MSSGDHKAHAPRAVGCYVLTVSDTRTEDTDSSGRAIRELLAHAGHTVTGHAIVRDEPERRLVRPARLERATSWFVARRSIQLSYGRGL